MSISLRVLGIDPGFDRTGLGVIESSGGSLKWIAHDCIQTKTSQELSERLSLVYDGVVQAIKTFQPQVIGVEKLFFQTNVTTALSVGMARGVILLAIAQAHLPCVEMTPNQVKQGVAGHGQADKKQMQKMVQMLLKLKEIPKPDDAADALAIAMVASTMWRVTGVR